MGMSESSLTAITKLFSFLSHCKVPCDSPCCQSLCGGNNRGIFNIDTHEHISSDSDSEDTDKHVSNTIEIINSIYVVLPRWCRWWCWKLWLTRYFLVIYQVPSVAVPRITTSDFPDNYQVPSGDLPGAFW